jgi:hypothetical protein
MTLQAEPNAAQNLVRFTPTVAAIHLRPDFNLIGVGADLNFRREFHYVVGSFPSVSCIM